MTFLKNNVFVLLVVCILLLVLVGKRLIEESETVNISNTLPKELDSSTPDADISEHSLSKAPADLLNAEVEVILKMDGSNTIGDKLAPVLAAAYIRQLGAEVTINKALEAENEVQVIGYLPSENRVVAIQIKAHGSSTGFQAIIDKTTDIAMSSRSIKANENLQLLLEHGDMTQPESEHVIALDGLAIIAHPSNHVSQLTTTQLAKIFAGEITDWNQLGGPDLKINLYARDNLSGTYDTFNSLVLKRFNKKLSIAKRFESNELLVESVALDEGGIGFTGLAYAKQKMIIDVSAAEGLPAISPKQFSISSEDYVLSRRLFLYANKNRTDNQHVAGLIDLALSSAGQNWVEQVSFVPQKITVNLPHVNHEFPIKYQRVALNGVRLSMTFRMRSDRAEIDNKSAQDINHLVDYLTQTPHEKVTLVGFSAGESQDENADRTRSFIRSKLLAYELKQRGVRNVEIIALGSQLPIDSNSSENGRYKNNRTEVWLVKPDQVQSML